MKIVIIRVVQTRKEGGKEWPEMWTIEYKLHFKLSINLFSREKFAAAAISFCFSSSVMLRQLGSEPALGSGETEGLGTWNGEESLRKGEVSNCLHN